MALVIAMLLVLALAGIGSVVLLSIGSDAAVARNEAWGEAAAARAEAGLEFAKAVLAAHVEAHDSFETALPPARSRVRVHKGADWRVGRPADAAACGNPQAAGCRDYEVFRDEPMAGGNGRVYVGRVLRDVSGAALLFDPRAGGGDANAGVGGPDLAGVTIWIRRPVVGAADAGPPHDRAVLTAEARHPPPRNPDDPHAVSRLEMTLRLARRPAAEDSGETGYSDGLTSWANRPRSRRNPGSS